MNIFRNLAAWSAAFLSLDRKPELQPVRHVDLSRYMGSWRVIACMDNPLERDFVDAVETYRFEGGNQIGVYFEWRSKSFDAPLQKYDFRGHVLKGGSNARWGMRLFPPFSVSYVIIYLSPDYSVAAVAHPSRKFGWVLSRRRSIPEEEYEKVMGIFAKQRYDTSKFKLVSQHASSNSSCATVAQRSY